MARFLFHVENGRSVADVVEAELDDAHAARIEAARMLGELLKDDPRQFWDHQALKLIVTDEDHLILFVLDLSGIVAPAVSVANRA